jgi:tetratricopeptide (TPR) repeat protein
LRIEREVSYFVGAMNPLEPPDVHHLRAAQGWLELGNDQEALAELERVAPALRDHPDVLELRWQVLAQARDWDASLGIAVEIVKQVPERLFGWLHRAYSMRRASGGGLKLALDALLPAVERFPEEPIVPYNLACYTCQMGDLAEARSWLAKAFAAGETGELKRMALHDPDLKPLWGEIRK